MKNLNDKKMAPQHEEGIEQILWMNETEVRKAMVNSFSSIRYVIDCFLGQEVDVE